MITLVKKDLETGEIVDTFGGFTINSIAKKAGVDRSDLFKVVKGLKTHIKGFTYTLVESPTPTSESAGESAGDVGESVGDNTLTTGSAGESAGVIETRSLPKRKVIPTPEELNSHYPVTEEIPRRTWANIEKVVLTDEERFYVDRTKESIGKTKLRWRNDSNEIEGQICSYLKGGYHYRQEPADTIPAACENLLLDLGIYDIPWEI